MKWPLLRTEPPEVGTQAAPRGHIHRTKGAQKHINCTTLGPKGFSMEGNGTHATDPLFTMLLNENAAQNRPNIIKICALHCILAAVEFLWLHLCFQLATFSIWEQNQVRQGAPKRRVTDEQMRPKCSTEKSPPPDRAIERTNGLQDCQNDAQWCQKGSQICENHAKS